MRFPKNLEEKISLERGSDNFINEIQAGGRETFGDALVQVTRAVLTCLRWVEDKLLNSKKLNFCCVNTQDAENSSGWVDTITAMV
ncbi:unnamed protein product [Anisakis simplex]|uniref:RUN domain-containing protein n=1 Tax=Anisakis simplex TaxID=6269 RepID=A0A158PNQ7_ANISI|nr:unnamed protein product [Anisakis simplex]